MPRVMFPSFLLASAPFRQRKSSSDSASSCATTTSPLTSPTDGTFSSTPGAPAAAAAPSYLGHHTSYLRCARCAVDLCLTSAIVSRGFTGRWGRAYLVAAPVDAETAVARMGGSGMELPALPNTHVHRPVPRQLVTGAHTVSDVSCAFCGSVLGWKYVAADEDSQRYKVGKFILETKRVSVVADWEQLPDPVRGAGDGDLAAAAAEEQPPNSLGAPLTGSMTASAMTGQSSRNEEDVVFDSQDEDECEDLFAGVWNPVTAARRRRSKRFDRERGL